MRCGNAAWPRFYKGMGLVQCISKRYEWATFLSMR